MRAVFFEADVTVVTVSYNSSTVLPRMLASLPAGVRLMVVDNNGDDHIELQRIVSNFGGSLIRSPENQGFGNACNLGAEHSQTEFLLFLNPDARLGEGAISALLSAAAQYDENTVLVPRISGRGGKADFKYRSVLLPRSRWLRRGWPDDGTEVPVASGAAIFVRREAFRMVSFDPKIFMYHEDDDWSLRMRAAGNRLIFTADAEIFHETGHGAPRTVEIAHFKGFQLGASRVYAMRKHGRRLGGLRSLSNALIGLLSPALIFSPRKRAKQLGFLSGVLVAVKKWRD